MGELQAVHKEVFSRFGSIGRTEAYAAALAATSLGMGCLLLVEGFHLGNPWAVLALAAVAAVAERGRIRIAADLEASISLLPTVVAAVLFGPVAAMLVGAVSFIADLRRPYLRWLAITGSRAITGGLTGLATQLSTHAMPGRIASIALATGVGALVAESVDVVFTAATYRIRGRGRMRSVVRSLAPLALAAVPIYSPIVVLLALAYEQLSPWTLLLFFVPALAAHKIFGMYQEQRQLADELVTANTRLERANLSFATALVAALDARDLWTAGHSAAVAIYARDIAARLGLSAEEQALAHLSGLVHDIGKIGLPASLMEKPGALTLDERRHMQEHSAIGERILAKVDDYAEIAAVVRHHHERWDGQGYPDGLTAQKTPLLSRIIAVADAYNAMTSDRPYRDAMPSRVARMRLAQAVETQFDTTIVAAFEAILSGATEEYRSGARVDFSLALQELWFERAAVA